MESGLQELKFSRYNQKVELSGKLFLYNALTGGYASVDEEYRDNFDKCDFKKLDSMKELAELPNAIINQLMEGGFIIPKNFDEFNVIKSMHYRGRFGANKALTMTLIPTMNCNFRCPYCYEKDKKYPVKKNDNRGNGLLILQERQGEAMNKNQKQFIRPPYDSRFDQLNIINWNFPQNPTFQHGKYCIRFTLILGDGSTLNRQKGGFASAKEAMKYRDNLIVKLTKNQYMPYRFTLKEFYNFWLYYYIIDGCKYAYNTFKYYATPVKRFCEYFRPDTYMDSITTTDLKNFINKCETFSAYKAMMQMIQNSFQYAKNQQIIISNPAPLAIEICKKEKKITKPPTKKNAFTLNELMNLLLTARKMDYTFYLFLLLSASTGARVSETRAICFSKIDFQKKQLLIDCQLGRGYDNEGFDDNTLLSQKRTLKTRNSKRYVPLPDFIMDELYLARARYEETLKNDPEFDENLDFVLFRDHGKAIARPYYYFKKLMKKCNIDCTKHVWHDLRHTYATLLDQNNMNMKVVSEILGHYSEEFTNEVYVIHKPEVIIYDTSEVMNSFIESLKLDSTERTIPVYDISFIQEYLF